MRVWRLDTSMRVELPRIGSYVLKKPIALTAKFDGPEGLWCIENEALALSGYGRTLEDAIDNLEESLESLITGFRTFSDEELHEKSKVIKKRLLNYVDF